MGNRKAPTPCPQDARKPAPPPAPPPKREWVLSVQREDGEWASVAEGIEPNMDEMPK